MGTLLAVLLASPVAAPARIPAAGLVASLSAVLSAGLPRPARAADILTVSAASSLTEFARTMASLMQAAVPRVRVRLNLGGSDTLVTQVLRGAPVDVLMLADELAMQRAIEGGAVLAAQARVFARNRLALVSRRPFATIAALASGEVRRVALGNPATVPAGRYARAALQAAGLWESLAGRLVFAQNVRQALDYAVRGEADAAVVYATDAALVHDTVLHTLLLPGDDAIRYPLAPVRSSRVPREAARFVALAGSEAALARLRELGFLAP